MSALSLHLVYADNYRRLAEANILQYLGAGGELMWGAAVQAAQAAIHYHGQLQAHPRAAKG